MATDRWTKCASTYVLAWVLSSGCVGTVPDATGPLAGPGTTPSAELTPEQSALLPDLLPSDPPVMRRLTRQEYDFAAQDLLGTETSLADAFPPEETVLGWENNAAALTFSPPLAEQSLAAAERLGSLATEQAARFATCAPDEETDSCLATFIERLALRAWRRPATEEEQARLVDVATRAWQQDGFARGLEVAAATIFYSVPFLYRVELGDGSEVEGRPFLTRPTAYELASRLSFLLWQSAPDEALLDAAAAGELDSPNSVRAHAERMLDDPKARRTTAAFYRQWLHLDAVASINKDPDQHPAWSNEAPKAFLDEMETLLEHLAWQPGSTYRDLFTTTAAVANPETSRIYGLDAGESGIVALDSETRAGVFTRAGFLALEGFDQTSPVLRGHFLREQVLCDLVPPAPASVDNVPPPPDDVQTTRDRITARTGGDCAGCHSLMNDLGFAFENYDATGAFRTEENGAVIDNTGSALASDVGSFVGAVDLQAQLADSAQTRYCVARQWFRYAYGRVDSADELVVIEAIAASLEEDGDIRSLLLRLIETEAFTLLRREEDV